MAFVAAVTTSCHAPERGEPPSFALASADIVVAEDADDYPLNFVFLADADDPIWKDLASVELGDGSLAVQRRELTKGEAAGNKRLGNIVVYVSPPREEVSFDSLRLEYDDGANLTVRVGSWRVASAPATEFVDGTDSEVVAMPHCSSIEVSLPRDVREVTDLEASPREVRVAEFDQLADGVAMSFDCRGDFDFFVFSTSLSYVDSGGEGRRIRLKPITIGYQHIDDADLNRIAER